MVLQKGSSARSLVRPLSPFADLPDGLDEAKRVVLGRRRVNPVAAQPQGLGPVRAAGLVAIEIEEDDGCLAQGSPGPVETDVPNCPEQIPDQEGFLQHRRRNGSR